MRQFADDDRLPKGFVNNDIGCSSAKTHCLGLGPRPVLKT